MALLTITEVSGEAKRLRVRRRVLAIVDCVDQLLEIDGKSGRGLTRRRGRRISVVTRIMTQGAVLPGVIARPAVHRKIFREGVVAGGTLDVVRYCAAWHRLDIGHGKVADDAHPHVANLIELGVARSAIPSSFSLVKPL